MVANLKRFLSLALAVLLVVSYVPTTAIANENVETTCDHNYETVVTDPTCTEAGFTTYTCTLCGDSYEDDEVDALGHNYETVVTDPTCTEAGFTTYTCSVCSDSYEDDIVDAIGHTFEKGGETCDNCSEPNPNYKAPCEHSYDAVVTDPTCTEAGFTTYTCSLCGDSYTGDEVAIVEHTFANGGETCDNCSEPNPNYGIELTSEEDSTNYVAMIGDVKFEDLATAFDQAESGSEITLISDVVVTETIKNTKKLTLNLAGYDVTYTINDNITKDSTNNYLIDNRPGAELTIDDTTVDFGEILLVYNGEKTDDKSISTINNCGTLTLKNGSINCVNGSQNISYAIDNNSAQNSTATLNVEGGQVIGGASNYCIRMFTSSTSYDNIVNVTGGTTYFIWMQNANANANKATINITGGTAYYVYLSQVNGTLNCENIRLYVNTNSANVTYGVVAGAMDSNYEIKNVDGIYTMEKKQEDDGINTEEELVAAVAEGGEIDITGDIELTSRLDVATNVTINLNGNDITGAFSDDFGMIYVKKGGSLVVDGEGSITSSGTYAIGNYGTVTIKNGTVESTATYEDEGETYTYAAVYNFYYQADYYGTLNVEGGSIAEVWNSGVVRVSGGTVDYLDNSGALTVTGGTITEIYAQDGADAPDVPGAGTVTIADVSAVKVPEGYQLQKVGDGVYKVVVKADDAPDVDTSVSAGDANTDVKVEDAHINESTVSNAANNDQTKTDLVEAAYNLQHDASVVGTYEDAKQALVEEGIVSEDDDTVEIVVEVQPYLDMNFDKIEDETVTDNGEETTVKTMTVDIKAMYDVVAVVNKGTDDEETATIKAAQEMADVTESISITVPLPQDFVNSVDEVVYVHHYKDNGVVYQYEATLTLDNGIYYATFQNPNGFSVFKFSTSSVVNAPAPVIDVKYNLTLDSYMDFSFFIDKGQLEKQDGVTVTIEHEGKNPITVTNWETLDNYWRFRYADIAPAQYVDSITLTITDSNGNVIVEDVTTMKSYIELRISRDGEDKQLMEALLNYCTTANEYFY